MELSFLSAVSFLVQHATVSNVLLFLAVFLLVGDYVKRKAPKNFPPGPFSWPFIGSLPSFDVRELDVVIGKMSEKYGEIIGMHIGSTKVVIINGLQTVKEAFVQQGDSFAGRPTPPLIKDLFKELGVVHSNGHNWKQQRRFALSTLRNFGMGKRSLEERINEELRYLTDEIEEEKGQPFDPHIYINSSVSNVICAITFGDRFDYQDPEFQEILHIIGNMSKLHETLTAQLYNVFPQIMKHFPGSHQQLFRYQNILEMFIRKSVLKHRDNWNPSEPRDFIDCYLTEIEKFKDDPSSCFDEDNLVQSTLDLFLAGTETTSATLQWAILYMAKYTHIQEKVQEEIDRVLGHARQPLMENRKSMPYTNAVIHEVQRFSNIVSIGVPRLTTNDATVGGFHLPKGTIVIPNFTSLLFDQNEWKTSDTFNPENFLENVEFQKREAFVPFSLGNRVCLGEQLAKMELFLYFTSLLQRFSFKAPKDVQLGVGNLMSVPL
ncbi:hypothetical protein NDU88_002361 [Pleurodeles waltl]|uniref:Cytochrome P450 2J2-like n=1 Tax=Pleurodeles waltl TaxID=8319 RepID=A0AAV7T1Q5_PLEWA|nr:hypothetical protein NDU88_002361 [Pleurodeles waltl]